MFYSPFIDNKGNRKSIEQLKYSDLKCLINIDEGYQIEYKSVWDDSFKKKGLPKSITSFANSEGGWLFVGVNDDGSLNPIKKERTDFSQQVGEILKTHVSPFPRFKTRFLEAPDNKMGILIIEIDEGTEPPYICNGTVYTRVGSTSKPQRISMRADIDHLYLKRKENDEFWKEYCENKIFNDMDFPYLSIYMYNPTSKNKVLLDGLGKNTNIVNDFAKQCQFQTWMPSTYFSYILLNSQNVSTQHQTVTLELFRDWNIKFYFPLIVMSNNITEQIVQTVIQKEPNINLEGFKAIDALILSEGFISIFGKVLEQLIKYGCNLNEYKIKIELNNIKNSYLFFSTENHEWIDFIISKHFRYSPKNNISLSYDYSFTNELGSNNSYLILAFAIASAFGYAHEEFLEFYYSNIKTRALLVGNGNYSNTYYQEKLEYFLNNFL